MNARSIDARLPLHRAWWPVHTDCPKNAGIAEAGHRTPELTVFKAADGTADSQQGDVTCKHLEQRHGAADPLQQPQARPQGRDGEGRGVQRLPRGDRRRLPTHRWPRAAPASAAHPCACRHAPAVGFDSHWPFNFEFLTACTRGTFGVFVADVLSKMTVAIAGSPSAGMCTGGRQSPAAPTSSAASWSSGW